MLIVRRKSGEAIAIGGGIEVEVLETGRGSVTLGVRAPPGVEVLRAGLELTRIQNARAARGAPADAWNGLASALRSCAITRTCAPSRPVPFSEASRSPRSSSRKASSSSPPSAT